MILPDGHADRDIPPRVNLRWADRSDALLAECAEALGCTTAEILAAQSLPPEHRLIVVMYTPGYPHGDKTVWAAAIQREGEHGVMRVVREEPRPGVAEEIEHLLGADPE